MLNKSYNVLTRSYIALSYYEVNWCLLYQTHYPNLVTIILAERKLKVLSKARDLTNDVINSPQVSLNLTGSLLDHIIQLIIALVEKELKH